VVRWAIWLRIHRCWTRSTERFSPSCATTPESPTDRFREGALTCPEVNALIHVTGRTDFQLNVSCAGTAGLNALLTRFTREFGAEETLTTVVLERVR
jgi:hypothetical protein